MERAVEFCKNGAPEEKEGKALPRPSGMVRL